MESRNSIYHSAVTFANAFMQAGTTSDEFLRQNLDWLSRATNWSKFSATAALGVIHKVNKSNKANRTLYANNLSLLGSIGSIHEFIGSLFTPRRRQRKQLLL